MVTEKYHELEILERSKENPKDFEAVYNHYFDDIFLFVKKRVVDKDSTFDIVQQVFFNALTSLKSYKHRGFPFSSFLYKIAINECNQYFRNSQKIRYVSIDEESADYLMEEFPFMEDDARSMKMLKQGFQKLSKDELNLIELRYFEKRSYREIGQIISISENTCKVKTHRVIKKLKKIMKDEK